MFGRAIVHRHLVQATRIRDAGIHGTGRIHCDLLVLVHRSEPDPTIIEIQHVEFWHVEFWHVEIEKGRVVMASKRKSNRNVIIVGIVGIVVAALAVALFVGGSDDSISTDSGSDISVATNGAPSGDTNENQPVSVVGDALAPFATSNGDPAVGMTAPGLDGRSFDGSAISITPGDGKAYMVVFLAHWCPHCNAEIPQLIKWKESGAVPEGLEVIGISTSVASDRPNYPPSQWTLATGWPWKIMADSAAMDATAAYGVTAFPFFTVIGEDGLVKVRVSGEVKPDVLDQILASALG